MQNSELQIIYRESGKGLLSGELGNHEFSSN
jgi:hypothetical protein